MTSLARAIPGLSPLCMTKGSLTRTKRTASFDLYHLDQRWFDLDTLGWHHIQWLLAFSTILL